LLPHNKTYPENSYEFLVFVVNSKTLDLLYEMVSRVSLAPWLALTEQLFDSWYAQVTDLEFVVGATFCFAQMWVGASVMAEHSGRLRELKNAGKYESLTDTLNFFENANKPLLPAEISEAYVRNYMKL
jgi:hypothetical protein